MKRDQYYKQQPYEEDAMARIRSTLLERMKNNNMSLSNVKSETGISKATISRVINYDRRNHKMIDLSNFIRLCVWLNVSADYLLGIEGDFLKSAKYSVVEKIYRLLRE